MYLLKKVIALGLGVVLSLSLFGCSNNGATSASSSKVVSETPEQFVTKCFSTDDVEKLATYMLDSDAYKKDIYDKISKKQYDPKQQTENFKEQLPNLQFTNLDSDKDIKDGDYVRVRMSQKGQTDFSDNQVAIFYLKKVGDTYKLDRQASSGGNDMSFMEYKANAKRDNTTFRVYAKLDDYYNYEFRDGISDYYSIRLNEPNTSSTTYFTGYIKKTSVDGVKLYDIVKDGKSHAVSVEISIPDSVELGHDIVLINKLVSDSWLIKK